MRKQSTTTKLREAAKRVAELEAEVASLSKSVSSEKSYRDMYSKSSHEREVAIEEVQAFLDSLPNPVSRTYSIEGESYSRPRSIVTRMAAWISTNK